MKKVGSLPFSARNTFMFPHKKAVAYVLLGIYFATFAIGICILCGVVASPTAAIVGSVFGLMVAQTALLLAPIVKTPNYFDEPAEIAQVKAEYEQTIAKYRNVISENERLNAELIAKLNPPRGILRDVSEIPGN